MATRLLDFELFGRSCKAAKQRCLEKMPKVAVKVNTTHLRTGSTLQTLGELGVMSHDPAMLTLSPQHQ